MQIEPVTLQGTRVLLEPYAPAMFDEVAAAALSAPEIFRFMPVRIATREDLAERVALAEQLARKRIGIQWVTRLKATREVIGSTAIVLTDATHRRTEIGYTWLVPSAQRTFANTEAKHLQLRHAFEVLGCMRVEFKTDARNARSRAALARLGAVEEGTLRAHMLCWDGHRRDSVYFSIIDTEWPALRAKLEQRLG
jgi:RimJ/RimL family protein N-acetyltransferase